MAKNIAVRDEIYDELMMRKGDEKSFSEVIDELLRAGPKGNIMDFYGVLSNLSAQEEESIQKAARKLKKMRILDGRRIHGG